MTTPTHTSIEELDDPSSVLVFARARRAEADRAESDVLTAAVIWAEQHPPASIDEAATWFSGGGDTGLPLAGPGAPLVSEFCLAALTPQPRNLSRRRGPSGLPSSRIGR